MNQRTTLTAFLLVAFAALASGQAAAQVGEGARGSPQPGQSRDGSGPADGAINGGTLAPGETGGVPDGRSNVPGERDRASRCEELTGTLREQCLKQQPDAGRGDTGRGDSAPAEDTRPRNLPRKPMGPAPDMRGGAAGRPPG